VAVFFSPSSYGIVKDNLLRKVFPAECDSFDNVNSDNLLHANYLCAISIFSKAKEDNGIGHFSISLRKNRFFKQILKVKEYLPIRGVFDVYYHLNAVFNIFETSKPSFKYKTDAEELENESIRTYEVPTIWDNFHYPYLVITSFILISLFVSYYFFHRPLLRKIVLEKKELSHTKLKIKKLENQINSKNKQINSYFFNFEQKNSCIGQLLKSINDIEKVVPLEKKAFVLNLKTSIKNNLTVEKKWNEYHTYFEDSQYGFHSILTSEYPQLKANDLKICSLLRLNLPIKESADVLGISPESLKTSRYRLRKKLGIHPKEDIVSFLINLESHYDNMEASTELAS
jgi:DNA-binding CsgD family transcriptional regulator